MKTPNPLKRDIFEAPEGYFEHLPDRIQQRIRTEEDKPDNGRKLRLPVWIYAAAASVLLVVAGLFFFRTVPEPTSRQDVEQLLSEVPRAAMLDYLQTDAEVNLLNIGLSEAEQEELLLEELDTYELPYDEYEFEIYELEEYL
jgi:hypothetical protein